MIYATDMIAEILRLDPYAVLARVLVVASMYLLLSSFARWPYFYALVSLPSTVLHEFAHLISGWLLGGKPVGLSLLPKRVPGTNTVIQGHVMFTNMTWWNALPIATAPLYMLLPLGTWLLLNSLLTKQVGGDSMLSSFFALQCFMGCWPSPQDWAHARTTIYALLMMAAGIAALYLYFLFGGSK